MNHFLAIDLGAESGRGIVATLADGRLTMDQVHRWANCPVNLAGTLYWDLPHIFSQMLQAMRICEDRGIRLSSVGVDTWGVDFGLLSGGDLLANPVHYRDGRTRDIHEYSDKTMSRQEIFAATGCEPWAISSLFQLLAMQRSGSKLLGVADVFLNMPDLLNYLLTGRQFSERSIASTSNLMGADGQWSRPVIERFSLAEMFRPLIEPATVLGPLRRDVSDVCGQHAIQVVAVCGHDTSSAAAAVPAEGGNWAFLSCGTWSIMGSLLDRPNTSDEVLHRGYSNEYTLGGWYLLRNILGLWLVQELRRQWDGPSDKWDYPRMTAEASQGEGFDGVVDVGDASLLAPADMEQALKALLAGTGQGVPRTRGQLVRCVLESLALEYAASLDAIGELTGRLKDALYIVGGGIANELLCQFTSDACGMAVHAGAPECTAMGNALCQAKALGLIHTNDQIRQVVRNSVQIKTYRPQDSARWRKKRDRYSRIRRST